MIWPITNHTNKNAFLGTTFICLDIQEQKLEGRVPISTSNTMYQRFEEGKFITLDILIFFPITDGTCLPFNHT
ncbi:unnamed protein product [Brassica rapa subsp. narinosa]